MGLPSLLDQHGITPREVASGTGVALSGIYDILAGKRRPTTATVDLILAYLSERLGRRVTYEEAFGAPASLVGRAS